MLVNGSFVEVQCFLASFVYSLHGWHKIVYMTIPIVVAIIFFPSVILNLLAFRIFMEKKMRMRTSNILVLNTIVADFFASLLSMSFEVAHFSLVVYYNQVNCLLYAAMLFAGFVFGIVSFLMVTIASCERYVAVFKPYFYSAKLSHRLSLYYCTIVFTWLLAISIVASSFTVPGFKPTLIFLSFQISLLIINFYMNVKVFQVARLARKRIQNQIACKPEIDILKQAGYPYVIEDIHVKRKSSICTSNGGVSQIRRKYPIVSAKSEFSNHAHVEQYRNSRLQRENRKGNRMTFMMTLSLCICYLPFVITSIIWSITDIETPTMYTFADIAAVFATFKAIVNPVIYCYSMTSVRKRMYALVSMKSNSPGNVSMNNSTLSS